MFKKYVLATLLALSVSQVQSFNLKIPAETIETLTVGAISTPLWWLLWKLPESDMKKKLAELQNTPCTSHDEIEKNAEERKILQAKLKLLFYTKCFLPALFLVQIGLDLTK